MIAVSNELAALCGALCTVAMGLLLGVIRNARQQLVIWTAVLMFPLFVPVLASGILPDLQVPAVARQIVYLLPTVPVAEATRWSLSAQVPWTEVSWGLGRRAPGHGGLDRPPLRRMSAVDQVRRWG